MGLYFRNDIIRKLLKFANEEVLDKKDKVLLQLDEDGNCDPPVWATTRFTKGKPRAVITISPRSEVERFPTLFLFELAKYVVFKASEFKVVEYKELSEKGLLEEAENLAVSWNEYIAQ